MSFSQFINILRARYKIALFAFFVTVSTALVVSLVLPKSYKATAAVIANYKGMDPVTGLALSPQLMPGYMATQTDIITSKNVALKVVDNLHLAEGPDVQKRFMLATKGEGNIRDWLADLLLSKLDAVPSKTSSVININFEGSNPQFAATIANAFADAYIEKNIQLKVEPSQKAASYFTVQIKTLRDDLDTAQKKLSKYQQDNGIVSVDGRLDVENARLNELSSQLVLAQSQAMEAESRERNASGNANESPDVVSNPLVQNLKTSLATAEAKFADTSEKYDKNHPQYIAAKAEIDKLRSELNNQIHNTSTSVASNARILKQREAEIRSALDAQKNKVLELNRTRDELSALTREVDTAQHAYDAATQRFTQNNFEGQSNQSDISILNSAVPPLKPSSPKILLNMIVAVFLGALLGITFALIAEMLDRKVRSPEDIELVLHSPILGVMPKVKLRRGRWSFSNLFKKKKPSNPSVKMEIV